MEIDVKCYANVIKISVMYLQDVVHIFMVNLYFIRSFFNSSLFVLLELSMLEFFNDHFHFQARINIVFLREHNFINRYPWILYTERKQYKFDSEDNDIITLHEFFDKK